MSIAIFADESGTHDITGKLRNTEVATICGYAGWKNKWGMFSKQWESHLKLNGVKVFHFSELNDSKRHPNKYPCYRGWNDRRKDAFVLALARIAAKNTICPVGGNFATGWNHDENVLKGKPTEYPYKHCFDLFFKSVRDELQMVLPNCRENILFFFDRNDNPLWHQAFTESWIEFSKIDKRFVVSPSTGNKELLIPLQAADLIANPTRRIAVSAWEEARRLGKREPQGQPMDDLLQVLYRKMPNSSPWLKWVKKKPRKGVETMKNNANFYDNDHGTQTPQRD